MSGRTCTILTEITTGTVARIATGKYEKYGELVLDPVPTVGSSIRLPDGKKRRVVEVVFSVPDILRDVEVYLEAPDAALRFAIRTHA